MTVFLTGASGFVGSHILRRLLGDGHEVRALVHARGALINDAAFLGHLQEVPGDITADLTPQVAGCETVINLIGIIHQHGKATFEAIHHQGTKNLVEAASQVGVKRFVQMSALGARPGDASAYHTTKFAAEEDVRRSGIPFVVLRPSLIVGPGSAFLQQMVKVMGAAPLIRPIPGTGKYRFQPIHVDDVVECFVQALTNEAATGQTVDLVGGEELTLDEIGEEIAACLGVRKRVLHIPMPIMMSVATLFELLPVQPPVNRVQLTMMREGSTADCGPMKRIFRVEPVGFRAGLRSYLGDSECLQK